MKKTLLFSHLSFLDHGRPEHPENRSRLDAILAQLQTNSYSNLLDLSFDRLATPGELCQIHTLDYVNHVLSLDGKVADLDLETPLTSGSVKAARLAAGLSLELVERVLRGDIQNGFLLGRPPGHHSRPSKGMGFCVFNNIALAAKAALSQGISKILIFDWDVHHGNGTQESFYNDNRVLFIDLHQENLFPSHSGLLKEEGEGQGHGYTINVPLPHSCRDSDYLHVFDHIVSPLAKQYQPELILVSAGFDAHESDPLGSMYVTTPGFGLLTQRIHQLAKELCGGKLLLFLEGGYDPIHLARNVLACISALTDEDSAHLTAVKAHHEEVTALARSIYEKSISLLA